MESNENPQKVMKFLMNLQMGKLAGKMMGIFIVVSITKNQRNACEKSKNVEASKDVLSATNFRQNKEENLQFEKKKNIGI